MDKMQNSTPSQMKMLLTRLGENSRLAIIQLMVLTTFNKFKSQRSDSVSSVKFDRDNIKRSIGDNRH